MVSRGSYVWGVHSLRLGGSVNKLLWGRVRENNRSKGRVALGTLKEAVAVVTGASRGLGAAISEELAAGGAKVVVNYSSSKGPADELVAKIEEAGGEAVAVQADGSDAGPAQALIAHHIDG